MKTDQKEKIGTCESCDKPIYDGDDHSTWADGPITCRPCTPETSWKEMSTIPKDRVILMKSDRYAVVLSVVWDAVSTQWIPCFLEACDSFDDFAETAEAWMDIPA